MKLIKKCELLRDFARGREKDWVNYQDWSDIDKKAKWNKAGYTLKFGRFIRGDVIELYKNNEVILGFADQSFQYSFIGIHDITHEDSEITNAKIFIILELLRSC